MNARASSDQPPILVMSKRFIILSKPIPDIFYTLRLSARGPLNSVRLLTSWITAKVKPNTMKNLPKLNKFNPSNNLILIVIICSTLSHQEYSVKVKNFKHSNYNTRNRLHSPILSFSFCFSIFHCHRISDLLIRSIAWKYGLSVITVAESSLLMLRRF